MQVSEGVCEGDGVMMGECEGVGGLIRVRLKQ